MHMFIPIFLLNLVVFVLIPNFEKSMIALFSTFIPLFVKFELFFCRNYGVPLHLIRELYETFRNFKIRVADYVRYRKITSNMNDRFPDATPEELNALVLNFIYHMWCEYSERIVLILFSYIPDWFCWLCRSDATCIICREEMTTAKKLICGHLFHVHCLRSWLERQHTCPTCRALVVPPENGTSAGGQNVARQDAHQQGKSVSASVCLCMCLSKIFFRWWTFSFIIRQPNFEI